MRKSILLKIVLAAALIAAATPAMAAPFTVAGVQIDQDEIIAGDAYTQLRSRHDPRFALPLKTRVGSPKPVAFSAITQIAA